METVRILLTDRNRHVRELLRRELETEGYVVAVARNAQEILGLLAHGELPDLLILDLEIPYLAEVNLLESLKTTYPSLPVIIHSFQPENPREFIATNVVAFLEKTEDPHQLKQTIAALVQKKQRRAKSEERIAEKKRIAKNQEKKNSEERRAESGERKDREERIEKKIELGLFLSFYSIFASRCF